MTNKLHNKLTMPITPDDHRIIAATQTWLQKAVIGLNLCPFAKAVWVKQQIRFVVSAADQEEELLGELRGELQLLNAIDPEQTDTTLLITPHILHNFLAFNDFLHTANNLLIELELEGTLQIASFHPQYQFAGTDENDMGNFTNRSPFPILHLLRESSMERAVAAFPDASHIFEKNIACLQQLGQTGWQTLMADADVNN